MSQIIWPPLSSTHPTYKHMQINVLWWNQHCLLLPDLKVGFGRIMGRFKVGFCRKRRSLLVRLFEKILELTQTTTLPSMATNPDVFKGFPSLNIKRRPILFCLTLVPYCRYATAQTSADPNGGQTQGTAEPEGEDSSGSAAKSPDSTNYGTCSADCRFSNGETIPARPFITACLGQHGHISSFSLNLNIRRSDLFWDYSKS